ncbi:glycosyltransferase family 2 protein [Treponema socranskii]|uniref:glycosyltransferase n=1 Tax=Treponema socranskii TaxID=53419 RepID=UPI003D8BA994
MTDIQAVSLFHMYGLISLIAFVLYIPRLLYYVSGFKKPEHLINRVQNRFAVLIPARDESAGIGLLLDSLARQTYDRKKFDTFVIVDSEDDPTCAIAEKYESTYVQIVKNQTCKGMALDGSLKELLSGSHGSYDAYIIIDGDNIASDNFIEEMNNALASDVQIVLGKREVKNYLLGGKKLRSLATNCSALTYTFLDKMGNAFRAKAGVSCTMCGTGVMVRRDVIEEIGGWPYRSFTEDLEMTINAILNGWSSCFYEYAVVYTEEALSHKALDRRRERWLIGYMQIAFKYRNKIVKQTYASLRDRSLSFVQKVRGIRVRNFDFLYGFGPLFLFFGNTAVCFVLYMIASGVDYFKCGFINFTALKYGMIIMLILYGVLVLYTFIALIIDPKALKITFGEKLAVLLYNPFFIAEYAYFYVAAFFTLLRNPHYGEGAAWQQIERIETVMKEAE